MTRRHADWLAAYLEYHSYSEAPKHMRFWCGVSAIAGALRRKVWIDQRFFQWYPNFYIILVAKPGIVSKSTTADVAMKLLRQVEGIKFGPDVVTWEALVGCFEGAREAFEYKGEWHVMSPLTLLSSEFGNLLDPQNRSMVDLYVSLWDGRQGGFEKVTKTSGSNTVVNPWINMLACTTPAWIAGSFPQYMIGGGFTSRCIFVHAEEKTTLIANPGRYVPPNFKQLEIDLVADLQEISTLCGEYKLTEAAYDWTEAWYKRHWAAPPAHLNTEQFEGYLARKQTHMYKLAMILAAARSNRMELTPEIFADAEVMITDLEPDMAKVFARIGRSDEAASAEKLLMYIRKNSPVRYDIALQHVRQDFPKLRDFEAVLAGLVGAQLVRLEQGKDGKPYLVGPPPIRHGAQ